MFILDIPSEIKALTEEAASEYTLNQLKAVSKEITRQYKEESGKGKLLVSDTVYAAVYSVVRMPATFGAVYSALYHTAECVEMNGQMNLLDVGAGTGSGVFAAAELFELSEVTCLERAECMRNLGKQLTESFRGALPQTRWIDADLRSGLSQNADIVLSSYVLNEMTEKDRMTAVRELWSHTDKLLLIVEPGTPDAFSQLLRIKKELSTLGAEIAAPCSFSGNCPLEENDWCHFTVRVQRSRLHRMIKEADVPYEDEKYSYMAFVKGGAVKKGSRILRHPVVGKGNIRLELCTADGRKTVTVTKRDRELFRSARKAQCGDLFADC